MQRLDKKGAYRANYNLLTGHVIDRNQIRYSDKNKRQSKRSETEFCLSRWIGQNTTVIKHNKTKRIQRWLSGLKKKVGEEVARIK